MGNYTILIVDDEDETIDIIERALRPLEYGILTANMAEEGMNLVESNKIDLIISDNIMPGITGVEFLQDVRRHHPEIISILLTGYADLETAMDAINSAGVYKFMTKPVSIMKLIETVKSALELKDLVKERNLLMNKVDSYETQLDELEKKYPGITQVDRDKDGSIVVDL